MRVVGAVAPYVRERELTRALRKHPSSITAYDLTLQALDMFYRMDRPSIVRARELLEQAIQHDPDYAPAYSHLASLRMRWIGQGWSEDELADQALAARAAAMAIERDRNDAVGLAIYGHLQSYLLKDYDAARNYLERALTAGPSCAWAWAYSSLTCGYLGDAATALARAERGSPAVTARCRRLLAGALPVAGLLPRQPSRRGDRMGAGVGCPRTRQYLEPALPHRKSGSHRRHR